MRIRLSGSSAAQHCFAADAAGAASGLGAIFTGDSVPPAMPVQTHASSAAESRRWAATPYVNNPLALSEHDMVQCVWQIYAVRF